MSKRLNRAAKKRIKVEEAAVREILNRWQPIPGAPEDEYECLVHHLLSHLHADAESGPDKIAGWISEEMQDHFGLDISAKAAVGVSRQIAEQWGKLRENA